MKQATLYGMYTTTLITAGLFLFTLTLCATAAESGSLQGKALYHVVSLKFKEGTSVEQIKAVEGAFVALKTKIPGIDSLNWGTNVSPEHHDNGFTHCFVLTFASEKDRDTYLAHAEHKAFGGVLHPILDQVLVIDFWSKN